MKTRTRKPRSHSSDTEGRRSRPDVVPERPDVAQSGTGGQLVEPEGGKGCEVVEPVRARAPVVIPPLAPLADQTDPLELRRAALSTLDAIAKAALGFERMTRSGEFYPAPDFSAAIRAIEVGVRVLGVDKQDPSVLIGVHGEAVTLIENARAALKVRAKNG